MQVSGLPLHGLDSEVQAVIEHGLQEAQERLLVHRLPSATC